LNESDNPECPVLTIETETAWTRVCQIWVISNISVFNNTKRKQLD
jgi:hypothetical protein